MQSMQMSIFDFENERETQNGSVLKVGDKIGRVVKGEVRIGVIEKVEGRGKYTFYRTNRGCYSYKDGLKSIQELQNIADENLKDYHTVTPDHLDKRITVRYAPRAIDGRVLWAQIGIFDGMLYWKENMTYEFLEIFENEKKLMKSYDEHKQKILKGDFVIVEEEHEMQRLYRFEGGKDFDGFASAEYMSIYY